MAGAGGEDDHPGLPLLWDNGTVTFLPLPAGATSGIAQDINSHGVIVGSCVIDEVERPVLWDNGEVIELPALGEGNVL